MLQTDFAKWNFAGSLPATLVLAADMPLLGGAMAFDFNRVIPDRRILMRQVWYTTPKLVHGLIHYDGPHQLFFVGYECGQCGKIFLVPDTVGDESGLAQALWHGCMERPPVVTVQRCAVHHAGLTHPANLKASPPVLYPRDRGELYNLNNILTI